MVLFGKRYAMYVKIVTMNKEADRLFLRNIPDDFPLVLEPYRKSVPRCAIDGDEIVERLKKMIRGQ